MNTLEFTAHQRLQQSGEGGYPPWAPLVFLACVSRGCEPSRKPSQVERLYVVLPLRKPEKPLGSMVNSVNFKNERNVTKLNMMSPFKRSLPSTIVHVFICFLLQDTKFDLLLIFSFIALGGKTVKIAYMVRFFLFVGLKTRG